MAPNIIGLALIVVGIVLMLFLGVVGIIVGFICLLIGIGVWWMSWQRRRRATT
jgi:hypothetical protein